MQKKITKNYLYNLSYQILTIIIPIITTPYLSRVLGAEKIGIYSYTLSITTYFILFGSLGVASYGQREIAFLQDDKKEYSKTFWEIVILRFITMMISSLIFFITFVYFNNEYHVYYQILLLELFASCFDISWFFQGLEDFKKTVLRNIIIKIISIICIFIFVKSQSDLYLYFIIYVLSNFLGNFSLWFYLKDKTTKVSIKSLNVIKHLKATIILFIPQIAIQIYTVLDKVMIGIIISNKSEVGYYEQAQKVVKMLLTLITALSTVIVPRVANEYKKGNMVVVWHYIEKSLKIVGMLAIPMIIGLFLVSDNFVPLFFGKGYEKVGLLMCIISPILLFIGTSSTIGNQYLLATKKEKKFTISVISGAIMNFIMNLLLIKKYGALGASISTVIAEAFVTVIQIYYLSREFNIFPVLKKILKYLLMGCIMFIVCYPIRFIVDNNLLILVFTAILGIITYGIMLVIFKEEEIMNIINKIRKKVFKEDKLK